MVFNTMVYLGYVHIQIEDEYVHVQIEDEYEHVKIEDEYETLEDIVEKDIDDGNMVEISWSASTLVPTTSVHDDGIIYCDNFISISHDDWFIQSS